MTSRVQEILDRLDLLSDGDKREATAEILRRGLAMDIPSLSDNDLAGAAEDVFLQLDSCEQSDAAQSGSDGEVPHS